jgi:hypothetical protein
MNKDRGIALETIAYVTIALVGLILVFMLVGSKISPAVRNVNCRIMLGLRGLLPLPEHLKPPLPAYCSETIDTTLEECVIYSKNPERISFELAAYILACWEKTGKINLDQDKLCYECYIRYGVDGIITENMVRDNLMTYGTGYENILDWKAGSISTKTSVGIRYNATSKLVEVI